MPLLQSQLKYRYNWSIKADAENDYYKKGFGYTYLDRTEGYEMLHFINHLVDLFGIRKDEIAGYVKIEMLIKEKRPDNIRTHKQIENWIRDNWKNY